MISLRQCTMWSEYTHPYLTKIQTPPPVNLRTSLHISQEATGDHHWMWEETAGWPVLRWSPGLGSGSWRSWCCPCPSSGSRTSHSPLSRCSASHLLFRCRSPKMKLWMCTAAKQTERLFIFSKSASFFHGALCLQQLWFIRDRGKMG